MPGTTERNQVRVWVQLESSRGMISGATRGVSPRGRERLLAVAYPWEVAGRQDHRAVKQPTLLESRGGSHGSFQGEGGRIIGMDS